MQTRQAIVEDLQVAVRVRESADSLVADTPYGECLITAGYLRDHPQVSFLKPVMIHRIAYRIAGELDLENPRLLISVDIARCDPEVNEVGEITGVVRFPDATTQAARVAYGLVEAVALTVTGSPSLVRALGAFWDTEARFELRRAIDTAMEYTELLKPYRDGLLPAAQLQDLRFRIDGMIRVMAIERLKQKPL